MIWFSSSSAPVYYQPEYLSSTINIVKLTFWKDLGQVKVTPMPIGKWVISC